MKQTTNYEIFKFRDDNREGGPKRVRVERLKASIKSHNLLHLRPIAVNGNMEIIDGQHRLIAAKELGLPIYYEVDEKLKDEDILLMNEQTPWGMIDYFNFHVKHHKPEYLKLETFMKQNSLSFNIALKIMLGGSHKPKSEFRNGNFVFNHQIANENYELCWRTIQTFERLLNRHKWMSSTKVWQALIMLFNHPNFNEKKWFRNLEMLIAKVTQKVSSIDYFLIFKEIHNFRNQNRIEDLQILEDKE